MNPRYENAEEQGRRGHTASASLPLCPAALDQTVRIGVTGHRFLAEVDKLVAAVDEAIRQLEATFPDSRFTIVSSLAEGADRLVARRVLLQRGAQLIVPLPLPLADYVSGWASQHEFWELLAQAVQVIDLPPQATHEAAYDALGRYVLDHCDVLVAIWDGQEAQGQGGTGSIVAEARRRGLPLAWIRAGNRRPGTEEPTSLGEEQGRLTLERWPG